jgi:surface polysaccharide O-acyltransferase-like enzyme
MSCFFAGILACIATGLIYDAGWLDGSALARSWLFGSASVLFGIAIGRSLSMDRATLMRRLILLLSIAGFIIALIIPTIDGLQSNAEWQWTRQSAALLLIAIALQFIGRTPRPVTLVATLTMGIYLIHPWVQGRIYKSLLPRIDDKVSPQFIELMNYPAIKIAAIWLVSASLVWLLRKWKPIRHVM